MEMEKERFSVDAVPISKGATVGDVMKLMFPIFEIDDRFSDFIIMESHYPHPYCKMQFDRKVWDMPYEAYKEKKENMGYHLWGEYISCQERGSL